jgi:class 3 adenylate cyclase
MPELVPRVVLDMVARGEARREWRALALFADVSGFTAMTEALASHGAEGAELLADALRDYFDPMLALVQEAGGLVTGFAGDAFTTLFPDDGGHEAVEEALLAASGMRDFFLRHPVRRTPFGDFPFALKLGLCSDRVACEVVRGRSDRHVGYFRGPAIDRAAAAEQSAGKGEVVLAPEILRRARGWSLEGGLRAAHGTPRSDFPDGVPSAGLRGEALFLPRSALGFPTEGEFRDVVPVFFAFDEGCDARALSELLIDELLRHGDGALRVEFGDKGSVAWTFFGAPVAFEDQADRALSFARSVVARSGGGVRAGVTRGVAYAGFLGGRARAEFTCLGRAVNLAARLMARAPAGEVWCSPGLRERARFHDFVPRGEHAFKGFSRPVAAFQAVRRASPAPPPPASLVARSAELTRLEELLRRALEGPSPGVIYLDGDAGLGKTTLLAALRARLLERDDAPVVLWGGCRALGGQPLGPLREALWGERDVLGEHPAEEITGTLTQLASWGPVVLFLDDAVQLDDASLALLRDTLARPGLALAVVLAVRPDDRGRSLRYDLPGEAHHLELLPFDEVELAELLRCRMGSPPSVTLLELVNHASGGNPLLATELAATLRGKNALDPAGLLPEEVTPLLVSRLDRLSVNVRRTVQVASALGPTLDADSLLELMNRQPRVLDYVRLAAKARVWSHDDQGRIAFRSGMLRDAAAQMLPRARLRRLLREAAEIHARRGRSAEAIRALEQLRGMLPDGPERARVEEQRRALERDC